ncbi:hypothetical protein EBT16_12280, partial [bacterium]|nr:hypothetical protein [bacterium]
LPVGKSYCGIVRLVGLPTGATALTAEQGLTDVQFGNFDPWVKRDRIMASKVQGVIYSFRAYEVRRINNQDFVCIKVRGQAFLLHQIRLMIGCAILIARGVLPISVLIRNSDFLFAFYFFCHSRNTQTPFFKSNTSFPIFEYRVDKLVQLGFSFFTGSQINDEKPKALTYLRGSKAYPISGVHGFGHLIQKAMQFSPKFTHGLCNAF